MSDGLTIVPFLKKFSDAILNPIILLLFAIALLTFFWGLFQFIKSTGSNSERDKGKRHILYGLIGMFVMFSAYGLIHLTLGTFGIQEPAYPFGEVGN